MFKKGLIIYFEDFKFNNGALSKAKYFIVLKESVDHLILGTLPTRKNKIPSFVNQAHGCINIEEKMYNCYLFQKGKNICKNEFYFDLPTFIYGSEIEYYQIQKLLSDYPCEGIDYKVKGELSDLEFTAIIECFKNSNSVKRGIKKQLAI